MFVSLLFVLHTLSCLMQRMAKLEIFLQEGKNLLASDFFGELAPLEVL